jgi:hypothetical protein
MKKSILHFTTFIALFVLSVSAYLYVNLDGANHSLNEKDVKKEQLQEEKTDATLKEVEVLKKLIHQGATRLPISNF